MEETLASEGAEKFTEMAPKLSPQQTAQAVLHQILMHPETHDQTDWGWGRAIDGSLDYHCGTIACVGGWAIRVNGITDSRQIPGDKSLLVGRLLFSTAKDLLGLGTKDADRLFYTTTDEQAIHALEYLANGKEIDWEDVYDRPW